MGSRNKEIRLTGLYARNIASNLFGLCTVAVLDLFTPLKVFKTTKIFFFDEGGWPLIFCIVLLVCFLTGFLPFLIQRPISAMLNQTHSGGKRDEALQKKAERRLLNLPFIIGFSNLTVWVLMPTITKRLSHFFFNVPEYTSLFIFFRTLMIGMIALTLSFFLVEDYLRKELIPSIFPGGRLATVPGTIKLSILRRIRVLYVAGTSVPMIILLGTFFFTLWEAEGATISATEFGKEVLLFTLVLCSVFVLFALRLNVMVGESILKPIGEMLGVVKKIKEGDFNQRITVLSNDELGILGDAGNDMIAGLLERERIRDAFGKYVSPEIRDEILAGRIPLNGARTEATLLFSDLRDFTQYVEENDPEEVIRSMQDYFTTMQKAIRRHQGLVLQYVGDEIEAVFGVPLFYDSHADKGVLAALEMRKALRELNKVRKKEGKQPFQHGIGVHTGEVLAGNTGSQDRISYALIGDTVNLASRIQGLTKAFQCDILVSGDTVRRLETDLPLKKEAPQMVKGYSSPITVFQIKS